MHNTSLIGTLEPQSQKWDTDGLITFQTGLPPVWDAIIQEAFRASA